MNDTRRPPASLPGQGGQPHGGIASQMNADRPRATLRKGEGVTDPDELKKLITLLQQAEAVSQMAVQDIQIGEFLVEGGRVPLTFVEGLQALTRTEAAVLRFLGWGRSNADISVLLNVNDNTVRTHMNNAVKKLGVDGMRELNSIAGLLFHPVE